MKKKKSIWLWVLFIVMIIVIGLVIWQFIAGTADKLTLDEFNKIFTQGGSVATERTSEKIYNGVHVISGVYTTADGVTRKFVLTLNNANYDKALAEDPGFAEFVSKITLIADANSPFMSLIIGLLPMVILIGFYIWMFSSMSKGGMGGGMFGPGKSTRPREIKSDVKFSDVAGINEEKTELVELVDYLKNPNKYAQMGARVPKGVLMEGPPGTGKTLLAKAVAGEAGVAFFSMAGSEFEEMFVGLGASRVRDLFSDAKKAAPCIIFIDEIDAVGRKRSGGMGSSTNEQTLNQLLVEMDGFGSNSGVIVMAATNRVDVLDNALLRPGRFDRTIQISLPDIREREDILKLHSRNKSVSPEIDWKRIAERTPGFSGAQLENVLNEAAILVVRDKRKMITLTDIDEAIDRVVGGPAKKSRAMTLQDKQIVSYHEAGHALMGLKLESASKVQKVTIIPRGNAGGYTIMTPKDESNFSSKEDLFASIAGYLGGRAAEEIMFGKNKITTGAHDDLDKATNIARRMVTQFGMSSLGLTKYLTMQEESYGQTKGVYSDEVAYKIDTEINVILEQCYKTAVEVINKHKDVLELIAESLRVLETITAEQIDYIDKNNQLPKEVVEEKNRRAVEDKKKESGEILEFEPDEEDK
ncbi:ATP-dependent zinc metalloprotease FtsH [Spiroplasma monobiae]|uniref:ATP-dependent zinc metalloprotease FtsH n=1 Tax=Spiroplasma monobiae MQ-1 TaxID=1336748 RepID=A0A2K9LT54_SPISQ|nr:ATP-dependent zinc metalloprotease FtsH [Spiroplasma monobiae]AUM62266.1 cell division protein FtsH [Spiroplasma monobiae MQ-1]